MTIEPNGNGADPEVAPTVATPFPVTVAKPAVKKPAAKKTAAAKKPAAKKTAAAKKPAAKKTVVAKPAGRSKFGGYPMTAKLKVLDRKSEFTEGSIRDKAFNALLRCATVAEAQKANRDAWHLKTAVKGKKIQVIPV